MSQKQIRVPAFAADGQRLRPYSLEACWRLVLLNKVTATSDNKGRIRSIHFLAHGKSALKATANMGQRYTIQRKFPCGQYWEFKSFLHPHDEYDMRHDSDDEQAVERYLLTIFRAVPLSCMAQPEPPPPSNPKVVSIETGRRRRRTSAISARSAISADGKRAA